MLTNKPLGQPIEDMVEFVRVNPTTFGPNVSDDFLTEAVRDGTPARPSHLHDTTAFPGGSTYESWQGKLAGWQCSPARVSAGNAVLSRGTVP